MNSIFSIKLWLIFFKKASQAIFPTTLVLIFFAALNRKAFKNASALRMLIIALIFSILYRLVFFLSGMPFERRYFYSLITLALILGTPGIPKIAEFAQKLLPKRFSELKLKHITTFVLIVFCLICTGKALNPDFSKKWLKTIPAEIKRLCPEGAKPIVLTTSMDKRISYNANAEYLILSTPTNAVIRWRLNNGKLEKFHKPIYAAIVTHILGPKRFNRVIALDYPIGVEHLGDNIDKMGGARVFVIIKEEDEIFKKRFQDKNVKFPLKFIKTFRDKKKRPIVLYQGFPVKNENKKRTYDGPLTSVNFLDMKQ